LNRSPKPLLPTSVCSEPAARRLPAFHWSVRSYFCPDRRPFDSFLSMLSFIDSLMNVRNRVGAT
jgi:hypothetical protein